ncbi:hypothetical protein M0811_10881 [Anaeramoeba ignava]|uniref:Uncharacterized protein n=1 Tax=Anaeramoeba ignava TaxID=1746090 RepID=A0A9Q0R964_ANAIG|nr:hypothetical protein M0811_10881 [Anaeramoeba ignava]
MNPTYSIPLFLISFLCLILFIICVVRWSLLLSRTKQLVHQKIFFILASIFSITRSIFFLVAGFSSKKYIFDEQIYLIIDTLELGVLISAFLLLIFSL